MNISERALAFAIMAHKGQMRRDEPDKPAIIHPLIVGSLLKLYGYDDKVVAAGYLHDVDEDTKYTNNDIAKLFGGEIASLVMTSSEPDLSLPWEIRKKNTIKIIKDLPERNKAIICADKIANLEDLIIYFQKIGYMDFKNYKVGKDLQEQFFKGVYEALSNDWESPMLKRLLYDINMVFNFVSYDKEQQETEFSQTQKITAQMSELVKLKDLIDDPKPFIIECSGDSIPTVKSMQEIIMNCFNPTYFRIKCMPLFEKSDKLLVPNHKSIPISDRNFLISSAVDSSLLHEILGNQEILLIDQSIFPVLLCIFNLYNTKKISTTDLKRYLDYYEAELNYLVNSVIISYNSDFYATQEFKDALRLIEDKSILIDDNAKDKEYKIKEALLPIMRADYIKQLKLMLDNKQNRGY